MSKILVIDDEESIRLLLRVSLSHKGRPDLADLAYVDTSTKTAGRDDDPAAYSQELINSRVK